MSGVNLSEVFVSNEIPTHAAEPSCSPGNPGACARGLRAAGTGTGGRGRVWGAPHAPFLGQAFRPGVWGGRAQQLLFWSQRGLNHHAQASCRSATPCAPGTPSSLPSDGSETMSQGRARSLRILHILRAPVGGLFRHVVDLARGQLARGHQVGLIVDSTPGGVWAEAVLSELEPQLGLGLSRIAMSRHIGWRDISAFRHVARRVAEAALDGVHGHGAQGGAYARLVRGPAGLPYIPPGGPFHF